MDKLCVVVKKAHRVPSELLPLIIFDENLWLTLFFAGTLIAIIWILLRSINNRIKRPSIVRDRKGFYISNYNFSRYLAEQSNARHYAQIFIDTWMLFLSIPMRRLTRAQHERIFLSTVCLVGMIFVSIYQSGLATVFVQPIYFKDIDTLERLDNSGNEIIVKYSGYLTDVFPNDTSQVYRNLRNKMRLLETNLTAMDIVKHMDNAATITRKTTTFLDNYLYFKQKELFLIDKECPKNYFLAYMVPRRSPFLKRINQILMDISRYGFIWKWIDDFNYNAAVMHMKNLTADSSSTKVLAMSDLKFPFYILIGGSSFGLIVLVVESFAMIIGKRRKVKL